MISNQVIQNSIEELGAITHVELDVYDTGGELIASTRKDALLDSGIVREFVASPADGQVVGGHHLLKVGDEGETAYVLVAEGSGDIAYMVARIAVRQLENLMLAYRERFDRGSFFQNLLLDNMLRIDIYNRAQKLHIEAQAPRAVFIVETNGDREQNANAEEMLKSLFSYQNGDCVTAVDEKNIVLIKRAKGPDDYADLREIADMVADMMNTEAMLKAHVAYGTIVGELGEVSRSYKEAKMALEVGHIFYADRRVVAYNTLGIGRLIYQLPVNLCKLYIKEVFGAHAPSELDEETLTTVNKFFENNLNISETSRQLFIHRNTLVYRIEKLEKITGLDIRTFEDALTFKIAMMVSAYLEYLDKSEK